MYSYQKHWSFTLYSVQPWLLSVHISLHIRKQIYEYCLLFFLNLGYVIDEASLNCGIRQVVVRFPHENKKYLKFSLWFRRKARRCPATQLAIPPEFIENWGTECLNTRFPLPVCGIHREDDMLQLRIQSKGM